MSGSTSSHWPAHVQCLRVGDVVFDLRYRRVQRPDGVSELPQRMFDLLALFAAEPGVLHSRADLFQRIWSGVIVEDSNLSQSVWMLRRALGEPRRHWIRTVAKSGYVFDPPAPVEVIEAEVAADQGSPVSPPALHTPGTPARRQSGPTSPQPRALLAVTVLIAVVIVTGVVNSASRKAAAPPTIALVSVADPGRGEAAATSLLHAWLEWQLSMLPEVNLLNEAHLASGDVNQGLAHLVLLSTGTDATEPGQVYVQARIETGGLPRRIRLDGRSEQLPELVEAVTRQAMATLLPGHRDLRWPALRLDAPGIELHHRMGQARRAHDWIEAARLGQELVQLAPGFGLGHWQLARVHSQLNRLHPAQQHLHQARQTLTPAPVSALALMHAQQLSLEGKHQEAAEQFENLLHHHPHQQRLRLDLAAARLRAGQAGQASAALRDTDWRSLPVALRLAHHLLLARIELALGDPASAREQASQAERLAGEAGWHHERGFAAMALAEANLTEQRDLFEPGAFDRAAEHFEAAGDRMHALRARVLGAVERAPGEEGDALDTLLVQARDAGQHRLELEALRAAAFRHFRAGEIPDYRRRLQQTRALAQELDDELITRQLVMDEVNEAFAVGAFDEVRAGLDELADAGLEGEPLFWARQFEALLAFRSGQLERAVDLLSDAIADSEAGHIGPWQAMHRCLLAAVWLRRGEPTLARREFGGCGDSQAPVYRLLSEAGIASVDLYSGDVNAAALRLEPLPEQIASLPSRPDRWLLQLRVAELLVRSDQGEQAQTLYESLLADLLDTGYDQLLVGVHLGLAEIAATTGDWIGAEEQARLAQRLLGADDWLQVSRLHLLQIAVAADRGELDEADRRLQLVAEQALAHGDTLVELLALELGHRLQLPGQPAGEPEALRRLVARTGLRGIRHDWLLAPDPTRLRLASVSVDGLVCPAASGTLD